VPVNIGYSHNNMMHVIKNRSKIRGTYGISVREGAVNTMPQVPQNWAYGPFIALHLEHARAHVGDIIGYKHTITEVQVFIYLKMIRNQRQ